MLRCIAIDDEPLALELLADNISKIPYLQLIASSTEAMEAMEMIQQEKPDLVFLDIQMPGLTGLQLIKSLPNKPMFILVTAYQNYALEGFDLNVVDYLVKPAPMDRFIQACNKARELFDLKSTNPKHSETETDYFFINADYGHLKVVYKDIIWIEGLKDYIKIHLSNNTKPIVARMSMKSLEEQLPSSLFIRIQKSYIISKAYITAIRKNSVFIGTLELPIGEQYKDAVMTLIGKNLNNSG